MTMDDQEGFIWFDGKLVPWREAKVHVLTHALHYGTGVFEGVRVYKTDKGPAIFRLREHTDRLFRSARIINMPMPYDKETLDEAQKQVVRENNLASAYIRPMCFYGPEGIGLRANDLSVHVIVAAWKLEGSHFGAESLQRGLRVRTSSFSRHHVNAAMIKAKASGHYLNSMLAFQEAQACGYDEALMLDTTGFVVEGSGENLFIVRNGELHTPDLSCVLEGITRETIITVARSAGIPVHERRITRDEVYTADEAFFTGTAAEVVPIRALDDRVIGDDPPGPITKMLQAAYFDYVHGRRSDHPEWLTMIA
uniref:Branched-chain-amino-acid aminotransferase n=1 Tax=Candidatus Kentrum sp. FM TaxID=2126340 RepID=A0A450SYQ1_9GAMM|nr:MAG: branched-chain amino acid aminotransferase [Candidatus Kentron sp. FM]VFJ59613.1 MAG: branched-chain amino acid aminotransferase [Candidatus Kentron sp. FM]VFK12261.1 MAG: branched-chain amino acid aminotransferase [Candidatus Kentron sp. FM]